MKLNTHQRKVLGEKLADLGNLLGASYVIGDFMTPKHYSVVKALIVAVGVVVLYVTSMQVLPRHVVSKDKAK